MREGRSRARYSSNRCCWRMRKGQPRALSTRRISARWCGDIFSGVEGAFCSAVGVRFRTVLGDQGSLESTNGYEDLPLGSGRFRFLFVESRNQFQFPSARVVPKGFWPMPRAATRADGSSGRTAQASRNRRPDRPRSTASASAGTGHRGPTGAFRFLALRFSAARHIQAPRLESALPGASASDALFG